MTNIVSDYFNEIEENVISAATKIDFVASYGVVSIYHFAVSTKEVTPNLLDNAHPKIKVTKESVMKIEVCEVDGKLLFLRFNYNVQLMSGDIRQKERECRAYDKFFKEDRLEWDRLNNLNSQRSVINISAYLIEKIDKTELHLGDPIYQLVENEYKKHKDSIARKVVDRMSLERM